MKKKKTTKAELMVVLEELVEHRSNETEVLRQAYLAEGFNPDELQAGTSVTLDNTKEGVRRYLLNGRVIAEFKGTAREFLLKRLRKE